MGVASSSRTFFQQIGGSIGVALFGAIFARRLTEALSARLPGAHLNAARRAAQPGHRAQAACPPWSALDVFAAITHAIQGVFIWAAPTRADRVVLAWLIKEVPLRGRAPAEQPAPELVSQGTPEAP